MSDQTPRYTRSVDCIRPRGPFSRGDFYRRAERGDFKLHKLGRMSFVAFGSAAELQAHLIEKEALTRKP